MKPSKLRQLKLAETPVSGRIAQDDRGNATWEYRQADGTFSGKIDSRRVLEALYNEALELDDSSVKPDTGPLGPYISEKRVEDKPRRTLDDMRKLSEAIKRSK